MLDVLGHEQIKNGGYREKIVDLNTGEKGSILFLMNEAGRRSILQPIIFLSQLENFKVDGLVKKIQNKRKINLQENYMDQNQVMDIAREAIWTLITVSSPLLLIAMAVGLIIGIIQTLTQIQEITLVFVPKILLVFIALLMMLPFISARMMQFSENIFDRIVAIGSTTV